jgi:ApeA-like protein/HEPN superfamily Apea-like protein
VIGTQTYRGVWWLPSTPKEKHEGILTVTDGEASLDVIGHFGREVISEGDRHVGQSLFLADQERILGASSDGNHITLVDCSQGSGGRVILGGSGETPETAVYRARAAIVGKARFDEGEPVEFDHVEIRIAALETWLQVRAAVVRLNEDQHGGTIEFTRLTTIDFQLEDGTTATIRFNSSVEGFGNAAATRAGYEWAAWLGLKFPELRSLEDITSAVGWLRNLITLATGKPLTVLAVDAYRDDWTQPQRVPVEMHVYYPPFYNPDPMPRPVHAWELIFDFPQVRERFADLIARWVGLQEPYQSVMGLFFGTLYQRASYREQRFLQYAQAIETYDRLKRPEARIRPKAEHKALLDAVFEGVPEQHHDWLKGELAWSNHLNLADRIEHVLQACPNVAARIAGEEGVDGFVNAVKWTRNYYTHYDPKGRGKAATDGKDMHRLTVQLRAVLETTFLLELGFDCKEIAAGLERVRRFEEIDIQRR